MKKLMFAIAALAAGAATAAITSNNIVGYQNLDLIDGGITAGFAFQPVSGQTFDLVNITATGSDDIEGEIQIQTLDENGSTVDTYYYYNCEELVGWLDGNDNEVEPGKVTVQAGEGLWVLGQSGLALQTAGQVPTADVALALINGGISTSNPTAVPVDLTACYGTGSDDIEGEIQVQTLDKNGSTVDTYYYYNCEELVAWLDGNDNEVESGTVVMKPGEGLWVLGKEGLNFVFPAANIK